MRYVVRFGDVGVTFTVEGVEVELAAT